MDYMFYFSYKKGVQTKLPLERSSDLMFLGDSLEAEQDFKNYVVAVQPKKHTGQ